MISSRRCCGIVVVDSLRSRGGGGGWGFKNGYEF